MPKIVVVFLKITVILKLTWEKTSIKIKIIFQLANCYTVLFKDFEFNNIFDCTWFLLKKTIIQN